MKNIHLEKKNISRRSFLRNVALPVVTATVGAGITPLVSCGNNSFSADPQLPNIIFITADDLGWKDLSCYGNSNITTPHIDRLSREGATFNNAFVVSSSCAPSRASFITGQYPHTHGVTGLTHRYKTRALSPFHTTLPDLLSEAGYNTCLQGKWHVSPYLPASWYGYNERLTGLFPKDWKIDNADDSIEFISQNRNNRFYLEINFMQNHRDDRGEFEFDPDFPVDPESIHVPEYMTLPDWPEIREDLAKFYSQTLKMDKIIGDILQTLEKFGLEENTMIIFTSDNGPPYPGNKITLYDRGCGVPLIVRQPGKIRQGKRIDHLVNTIDIMPTLLESVGIAIPENVQGLSFYPMMTDSIPQLTQEVVFLQMTNHVHYIPTRAVRTDEWKYIKNYSDIAFGLDQNNHDEWAHRLCEQSNQPWIQPRVEEELYHLKNDPHEQRNLASENEYQDILALLREILNSQMEGTRDPFLNHVFTRDYDPSQYRKSESEA